jgi:hypothetical protein
MGFNTLNAAIAPVLLMLLLLRPRMLCSPSRPVIGFVRRILARNHQASCAQPSDDSHAPQVRYSFAQDLRSIIIGATTQAASESDRGSQ